MTRDPNETPKAGREASLRPYWRAVWWTTIAWIAVVAIAQSPRFLGADTLNHFRSGDGLVIAVASLFISYAAMLPSLVGQLRSADKDASQRKEMGVTTCGNEQRQTGLLVAGVMIRLLGTVALFLTCRYQMTTPTEAVAGMTIGWYVLLTFVEVLVLARELAKPTGSESDSASCERSQRPSPIKV